MADDFCKEFTLQQEKYMIKDICFKAVYGSSIYQYMKTYRMQTARVLLQDTSRSVTEIAATLGYDNPSKFSEAFKKEYGISPTLFRNSPSELDVS